MTLEMTLTTPPRHHRNGISGLSFWQIGLRCEGEELVAIVFPDHDADTDCYAASERTAIINPADPTRRYRRDNFADQCAAWINEYAGQEVCYS